MFGPVQATPYDLRFSLFGIPVHVTPWFWVGTLILSWDLVSNGHYDLLVLWTACLFVSILIHELGHAVSARAFGCFPSIYLYQFGGLAVFRPNSRFTTSRSVLVSFAGPAFGFLLYGLVLAAAYAIVGGDWYDNLGLAAKTRVHFVFAQLEWINLWWGLVNLLPILPLDGGQISTALLTRFQPYRGRTVAIQFSIGVSGLAALYFLLNQERFGTFGALFFGILCISNVQLLQQSRYG